MESADEEASERDEPAEEDDEESDGEVLTDSGDEAAGTPGARTGRPSRSASTPVSKSARALLVSGGDESTNTPAQLTAPVVREKRAAESQDVSDTEGDTGAGVATPSRKKR